MNSPPNPSALPCKSGRNLLWLSQEQVFNSYVFLLLQNLRCPKIATPTPLTALLAHKHLPLEGIHVTAGHRERPASTRKGKAARKRGRGARKGLYLGRVAGEGDGEVRYMYGVLTTQTSQSHPNFRAGGSHFKMRLARGWRRRSALTFAWLKTGELGSKLGGAGHCKAWLNAGS